jgi:hypothetical protein
VILKQPCHQRGAGGVDAGARQGVEHPPIPGPPPDPRSDPGAGKHGSDPWWNTFDDRIMKNLAEDAAAFADTIGWTHAAHNLQHYLDNSGDPLTVDPDEIGRDVAEFQRKVDTRVADEMRRLTAEAATSGTYGTPVPFRDRLPDPRPRLLQLGSRQTDRDRPVHHQR